MNVGIGYVVLYLNDTEAASNFWVDTFDFEVKKVVDTGEHKVITIGAKNSETNFELVPLQLMANNPYNLNLEMPSICLKTDNLHEEHQRLTSLGVSVSEIANHGETESFSIVDLEGNAFAVTQR